MSICIYALPNVYAFMHFIYDNIHTYIVHTYIHMDRHTYIHIYKCTCTYIHTYIHTVTYIATQLIKYSIIVAVSLYYLLSYAGYIEVNE